MKRMSRDKFNFVIYFNETNLEFILLEMQRKRENEN